MAKDTNERDPKWADETARMTFIFTLIGTALFAGAVILFILRA